MEPSQTIADCRVLLDDCRVILNEAQRIGEKSERDLRSARRLFRFTLVIYLLVITEAIVGLLRGAL